MDYNMQMVARSEHNLNTRSLPVVSEFGETVVIRQSWLRRLALRFSPGKLFAEIKQKYAAPSQNQERLTLHETPAETFVKRPLR